MYKLFVALRYLRRNWLNLVGVLAVAIGVAVLICVLSVMKGFDEEFRARIRATLSDLIVESWTDEPFDGYETMMAKVEKLPHVVAVAPQYEGLALIRMGKQSRYGEFHGVDLAREEKTTDFADNWRAWRGRQAREEIAAILARGELGTNATPSKKLADWLSRMRRADVEVLSPRDRRALRTWAKRSGIDLDAALRQAEQATPQWGKVEDPHVSPVFAGAELVVLGRDEDGNFISLNVGDPLTVISATDIFEGQVIRRCRIVGEFRSGQYEYDMRNVYLPLQDVQLMMSKPGRVTSVSVRLDSFDNAPVVRAMLLGILTPEEMDAALEPIRPLIRERDRAGLAALERDLGELRQRNAGWFAEGNPRVLAASFDIERGILVEIKKVLDSPSVSAEDRAKLTDCRQKIAERDQRGIGRTYRISTWEDKRRTFLRAVWLERRIMGFILLFVTLIAGFLVLSILYTTVISKMRDIGTLKSIGGSVGGIMSLFLLNGLLIGVIGSAIGTTGGVLITNNINEIEGFLSRWLGFRLFPPDIYYLDKVPVDQHPFWSTVTICVVAIGMSLLASAYPAWKASRMDAVEALRYE